MTMSKNGAASGATDDGGGVKGSVVPALVGMLFFLSGAMGLAYEVVWFKLFSQAWGSSSWAMAAVVSAFLLGLAVGARVMGSLARRIRNPLAGYACCEALIFVGAFCVPGLVNFLHGLMAQSSLLHSSSDTLRFAVRLLLAIITLGPVCFLMGATLPLIVKVRLNPASNLGKTTGLLYGLNTLGAATGCIVAGFYLLPQFGIGTTNTVVLLCTLGIACGAGVLSLYQGKAEDTSSTVDAPAPSPEQSLSVETEEGDTPFYYEGLVAAFFAGAAALALQMIWARQLALILGGSTYAFTATLFVFLIGTGLGSLFFKWWGPRRRPTLTHVMIFVLLMAITVWLSKAMIPYTVSVLAVLRPLRVSPAFNAVASIGAASVLQLLPTLVMGAWFPLLLSLLQTRHQENTALLGRVYASQTLGNVTAAMLTTPVLIPLLGISTTTGLIVALYGVVLASFLASTTKRYVLMGAVCAVPLIFITFLTAAPRDPRIENLGMYMYGLMSKTDLTQREVLYFREGASSNVLVTKHEDNIVLRVNGKADASSLSDMPTQLGAAYLSKMLRPEATEICVIGYGSGVTVGAALLYSNTEVVCAEIEPYVYEGARHFEEVNHRPFDSERFKILFEDGRTFIQGNPNRFDLIISEPSNPWMAGITNLFTQEFYRLASQSLRKDGLFAQWVPLYGLTPEEYAMVVRTFRSVFPYCGVFLLAEGDSVIVGSRAPILPSAEALVLAQQQVNQSEAIIADMNRYFDGVDVKSFLLSHIVALEKGVQTIAESGRNLALCTDKNLRLEFQTPVHLFKDQDKLIENMYPFLLESESDTFYSEVYAQLACGEKQKSVIKNRAALARRHNIDRMGLAVAQFGLSLYPNEPAFLSNLVLFQPDLPEEEYLVLARQLAKRSPLHANEVGTLLKRWEKYKRAEAIFTLITEATPQFSSAWMQLAELKHRSGQQAEAITALRKAAKLDPMNPEIRKLQKTISTPVAIPAQPGQP